jgi:hypothetical protein
MSIEWVVNGLHDHDSHLPVMKNIKSISNSHNYWMQNRLINNNTIKEFTTCLSNENWESVLSKHEAFWKYNTFLNILRTYETSFPTKTERRVFNNNEWITKVIRTSCKHKRNLSLNLAATQQWKFTTGNISKY